MSETVELDLRVSISLDAPLAEIMRAALFQELREIEADDPDVLALEHDLAGLWARALDRQHNPFAAAAALSNDEGDDLRWFGEVVR